MTMPDNNRTRVFEAFIDTDLGEFHLSVDVTLVAPGHPDTDEVTFRARQLLDLVRAAVEDEARRLAVLQTIIFRRTTLYDVARETNHAAGFPWTDPRTGVTYPPPEGGKS